MLIRLSMPNSMAKVLIPALLMSTTLPMTNPMASNPILRSNANRNLFLRMYQKGGKSTHFQTANIGFTCHRVRSIFRRL